MKKYFSNILSISFLLIIITSGSLHSQVTDAKRDSVITNQKDLMDILRKIFHKPPIVGTLTPDTTKASISLLPGISYNPANGLIVGVSASIARYYGSPKNTNLSSVATSISYTTKNQVKLSVQSNIYSKGNLWGLQGDWRIWKYNQITYGLGTQSVPDDGEDMTFNFVRLNENILRTIFPNFYLGLGYSLEGYFNINTTDSSENIDSINYNNSYSALHGYDKSKYISSGFVLNANYDTRDNAINSYKGILANLKYYNYRKFLGSDQDWQYLYGEFRGFIPVTKNKSYIMAFWSMANINLSGAGPYMSLPATGWDKYNSTGRGYIQGRFRGTSFLYASFENRFRLTANGLLGMVVFVNAESTSNPDAKINLLDYIEPAGGVGLRIKFNKESRTNICVDYGIGRYGSSAIFLGLGEFF